MTNIRARGFESPAQLREHLADIDQGATETREMLQTAGRDPQAEIEALKEEIADLRRRLSTIRSETEDLSYTIEPDRPWLRIAATVAATFVLGRLVQRLRLGTPGAAAVPLIAAQLGNRF